MKIIAAMSQNRVIGRGDGMPWDVPEEYEHYLQQIRGTTVIIGRKSYEIFGGDFTCDHVVVLSRSPQPLPKAEVCSNLPAALDIATAYGKPIFSCGGASVYQQTLPLASEMLLSTIQGDYRGDAYFPEFDKDEWHIAEEWEEPRYVFRRWVRG